MPDQSGEPARRCFAVQPAAREVLNLREYGIDRPPTPTFQARLEEWQRSYRDLGLCVLSDFLTPAGVNALVAEATRLIPFKYTHRVVGNAYLTDVDETRPEDHPLRRTEETVTSTIACDQIPVGSAIRQIYESPAVDQLVHSIVGCDELHHYACPLGAVNVAVMEDGDYLRWHFDQSEFVVSLHLQDPVAGGRYEYARDLRRADDPGYQRVGEILDGSREGVEQLATSPGSLILFRGMHTLHRVTPVEGARPRLILLYGYALEPGVESSDFLKKMRYGRTEPLP